MNRVILAGFVSTISLAVFAMTPAEREAMVQAAIEAQGGIVTIAPTGNVLRIVNAQKTLPPEVFTPIIADVQKIGIDIPIEVSDATKLTNIDPMSLARSSILTKKTGAIIAIVESKDYPTLLAAPENAWAIINLRNLKADKPTTEVLKARLVKEFWRSIGFAMGGANSMMGKCVMRPVASLKDLDRINYHRFGPEPAMKVISSLGSYGIDSYNRISYEDACQMGVAPQPTNDIQKAVWEKVHALPSDPIKIKPESQKVAE